MSDPTRPRLHALLRGAILAGIVLATTAAPGSAQTTEGALSPADSAAVAAAMAASDSVAAYRTRLLLAGDPDRFEFGVAAPRGYFDWLGTFGYRRRLMVDPRFEHVFQVEAAGGHKDYLSEGSVSGYWWIRPRPLIRPTGRVRPILEGGFGLHLVVQFADIVGFNDWASHAHLYAKGHLQAGVETDLGGRWGVALRGRMALPAHRPLDYGQIVLFLR